MTCIVIKDVRDHRMLHAAIRSVLEVFGASDDVWDVPEHVFGHRTDRLSDEEPGSRGAEVRIRDLAHEDRLHREAVPLRFQPCPRRGRHARLTDCWLCWGDVMRGVVLEPEVLSIDGWSHG
jgi:hypothetical protein